MAVAIGIDLGGTKIEIVALDESGAELVRRRRPTPRGDYDATLDTMAAMVAEVEGELGQRASVGVGHPGAISPATGLIKNANSVWLNDRPLDRDLMARLDRRVAFANDANCLALSEATDGAGAGADIVFTVILGTGVGGGIVVGGRVLTGGNAIAGEWGHNPLPWPRDDERPGPACYCGLEGCIETWCSGVGMAADHARVTGQKLGGPAIVAAADAGDPPPPPPSSATPTASPGASRTSSTSSIPRSSCWAAASPTSSGSTRPSRRCCPATSSPIGWRPGSCRPSSATARACAAPPGWAATWRGAEPDEAMKAPDPPAHGQRGASKVSSCSSWAASAKSP
jgi:fructokinase